MPCRRISIGVPQRRHGFPRRPYTEKRLRLLLAALCRRSFRAVVTISRSFSSAIASTF
jgi:hypothetical protein